MSINYGECSVCHSPMVIKDGGEVPHIVHSPTCFFVGHEDYDEFSDDEEHDCTCSPFTISECHPECCPICIEIGYNIYSTSEDEQEDYSY